MIVLAIDPGPEHSGVVRYDLVERRVVESAQSLDTVDVLSLIADSDDGAVVIERPSSGRVSSGDVMRTAEVFGAFFWSAKTAGLSVIPLYRREVLSALSVSGGSRDARVRAVCIEAHGGTKRAAVGNKKAPGPLYGVSVHAWQALGLVLAADLRGLFGGEG